MVPSQPVKIIHPPSRKNKNHNEDNDDTVIHPKPIDKENQKPAG